MRRVRILHLADVHLDRPFVGLPAEAARARRRELWETFRICLQAARDEDADLVTIGGDLWEDENVTADTRKSVAHELAGLGLPVAIICGNHDPNLPGGNYSPTDWPANVHVFARDEPSEFRFGGVSVWGLSWTGGSLTADFLDRFRAPEDDRQHLLLLHGTAHAQAHFADRGAHCPFDPARIRQCGFALCLAGHIHAGDRSGDVVYPGSPEQLGWGAAGRHGFALIDVGPAHVEVQLVDTATRRYQERDLDCTGASSSAAVAERLAEALSQLPEADHLCLRVDLVGEVEPSCEVSVDELSEPHARRFAALVLRDRTRPGYDLDALARQPTVQGRFVRRLTERMEIAASEDDRAKLELALRAGLRALDGRKDLG